MVNEAEFKVGDRVRCTNDADGQFTAGNVYVVRELGTYSLGVVADDRGKKNGWSYSFFEPVAAAQQLRIREGAYYRTRDGRKVGPMHREKEGYWWTHDDANFWHPEGRVFLMQDHPDDFIAEWPTYAGNPAAEVDNLRDEYGPVANDNGTATKFRVGDRVKFVDDYGGSSRGKEATVIKLNVWGDGEGIQIDQGGPFGVSTEHARHLRLVAPATSGKPQPAIVALIEDGQPKPAERPFVHPNREAASKEARRLAGKHRGREFGVYELVDTAQEEAEHEWQRLALAGRQTEAVDALVKQAGIARQAAYFAVRQAA